MMCQKLPIALCVLSGLFFFLECASAAGNLTQNSSRECAVCHYRWIEQFVEGRGTALAHYQVEDVAGDELMCFSCHDGSIDDSRTKVWVGGIHKTEVKPSDKVKIPKIFPLSPEGKIVCSTCHSAHSNPTDTTIERSVFMRVTNTDSILCEMCHVNQALRKTNHPVHVGKKPLPEVLFAEGAKASLIDPNYIICESCHTAHASVERTLVHTMAESSLCVLCHTNKIDADPEKSVTGSNHPLKVQFKTDSSLTPPLYGGPGNSLECLSCHKVHEHVPGTKALVAGRESLCSFCHADKDPRLSPAADVKANHPLAVTFKSSPESAVQLAAGENNTVYCFTCHLMHQHAPGTKALAAGQDVLCSSCHVAQSMVGKTDHDLSVTAPAERNSLGQDAGKDGACVSCHIPHKAQGPFLWSRSGLGADASPSDLCLTCHSTEGPGAKKGVGEYSHPVGSKVEGAELQLPLYTTKTGEAVMECHTCHNPHQWQPGNGNTGEGQGENAEGDGTNSFLRQPSTGERSLCLTCHPGEGNVEKTDHDLRITGKALKNVRGETVVTGGVCSVCHIPHNGTGPKLWAQPLSEKEQSPSSLCLSCHNKQGVAAAKTVGENSHPVGVSVDGSPELPLYTMSEISQVMECSTCHNPHNWRPGEHYSGSNENIEGDGLSSFLRESSVDEPKLCAKCHVRQSNVAGTDHDMRVVAPGVLKSTTEASPSVSICTPCHVVHNALSQTALWGGTLADGKNDFMARACYGCHNKKGIARKKLIAVGAHPQRIYFGYNKPYSIGASSKHIQYEEIPLYDAQGHKKVTGEISCPTCHDPHVWRAGIYEKGIGTKVEGTLVSSFLRKDLRRRFCYECHGRQTLFLYRYYHSAEERKVLMQPRTSRPQRAIPWDRIHQDRPGGRRP